MSKRDASLNDPDQWTLPECELPEERIADLEMVPYRLPFDICMELTGGDKKRARALHWGHQYGNLHSWHDRDLAHALRHATLLPKRKGL